MTSRAKPLRILAFDTSMKRPGVAIIEITARQPRIKTLSHIAPETSRPHGHRAKIIEGWALTFLDIHARGGKGFDYITREDFSARSSTTNYPVMAAWSACERAVNTFGLAFDKFAYKGKTALGIGQSTMKILVTGSGKAEKDEVEAAVREYTGYTGEFAVDDESDAAALGLAFAINAGLIDQIKRK